MKHLFKRFFNRSKDNQGKIRNDNDFEIIENENNSTLRLDIDKYNQGEKKELFTEISNIFNLSLYEGHVEHGYSLNYLSNSKQCPRCFAETEQCYGNFIYATQIAPRVMFAPAGYFCTKCPTVIINEDIIRGGINKKFRFKGVLGLDYEGRKEPDFFKTWNGEESIYILDENQTAMGLSTFEQPLSQGSFKKKDKSKKRKKMARLSRKQNRPNK